MTDRYDDQSERQLDRERGRDRADDEEPHYGRSGWERDLSRDRYDTEGPEYGRFGWEEDLGRDRERELARAQERQPDLQYGRYGWESDLGRDRRSALAATPRRQPRNTGRGQATAGPYAGRGPRGYHRSDERIGEEVSERLTRHGQIDARNINVTVDGGEVTLEGSVDSRRTKHLAEDIAVSVSGVVDVHNRLRAEQVRGMQEDQAESNDDWRGRIHRGMLVVGSDGIEIGPVKRIREHDFLVSIPMGRDVYVPFSACRSVRSDRVEIKVYSDFVGKQGWPHSRLIRWHH